MHLLNADTFLLVPRYKKGKEMATLQKLSANNK